MADKSLKLPADLVKTPKTKIDPSTIIDLEAFLAPNAPRKKKPSSNPFVINSDDESDQYIYASGDERFKELDSELTRRAEYLSTEAGGRTFYGHLRMIRDLDLPAVNFRRYVNREKTAWYHVDHNTIPEVNGKFVLTDPKNPTKTIGPITPHELWCAETG